jgi:hypothetical protein
VNQPTTGVVIGRDELANWLIRGRDGAIWCARSLTPYQDELLALAYRRPSTIISFKTCTERIAMFNSRRLKHEVMGR